MTSSDYHMMDKKLQIQPLKTEVVRLYHKIHSNIHGAAGSI